MNMTYWIDLYKRNIQVLMGQFFLEFSAFLFFPYYLLYLRGQSSNSLELSLFLLEEVIVTAVSSIVIEKFLPKKIESIKLTLFLILGGSGLICIGFFPRTVFIFMGIFLFSMGHGLWLSKSIFFIQNQSGNDSQNGFVLLAFFSNIGAFLGSVLSDLFNLKYFSYSVLVCALTFVGVGFLFYKKIDTSEELNKKKNSKQVLPLKKSKKIIIPIFIACCLYSTLNFLSPLLLKDYFPKIPIGKFLSINSILVIVFQIPIGQYLKNKKINADTSLKFSIFLLFCSVLALLFSYKIHTFTLPLFYILGITFAEIILFPSLSEFVKNKSEDFNGMPLYILLKTLSYGVGSFIWPFFHLNKTKFLIVIFPLFILFIYFLMKLPLKREDDEIIVNS